MKRKDQLVLHYALSFATLWGVELVMAAFNDNQRMRYIDCEEFDTLILGWAEEFVDSDRMDSGEFFEEHLAAWLSKEEK